MLNQLFSFLAGAALVGISLLPLVFSYKKRIRKMEDTNSQLAKDVSGFKEKIITLAASLKQSADGFSFFDRDKLKPATDTADLGRDIGRGIGGGIERIENTISESSKIATDIAKKTDSVVTIASRMEGDVQRGFIVLEKNVRKMQDIKDKNSGTINGIISLSSKVDKIRDIVRVISTITDQTKVIAFNAALEAASAGETGKRFAVIAGEVNRLADDIAVLTRQVREQAEEIQSSSSSLIVYSEESSDRIAEGYELIKNLEDLFKEILSGAEITSNQVKAITDSTHEQLKSSELIDAEINELSQGIRHFSGTLTAASLATEDFTKKTDALEKFLAEESDKAG